MIVLLLVGAERGLHSVFDTFRLLPAFLQVRCRDRTNIRSFYDILYILFDTV